MLGAFLTDLSEEMGKATKIAPPPNDGQLAWVQRRDRRRPSIPAGPEPHRDLSEARSTSGWWGTGPGPM